MFRHWIVGLPVIATALGIAPATARPASCNSDASIAAQPVADCKLADVRGGGGYLRPQLTPAAENSIVDSQSRLSLQGFASLTNTVMDNWWAADGAQLIANSDAIR